MRQGHEARNEVARARDGGSRSRLALSLALLTIGGCSADDVATGDATSGQASGSTTSPATGSEATSPETGSGTSTGAATSVEGSESDGTTGGGSSGNSSGDAETVATTSLATTGGESHGSSGEPGSSSGDGPPEDLPFVELELEAYVQVDRVGLPRTAHLLIEDHQTYNTATPVEDADAMFRDEIDASMARYHRNGGIVPELQDLGYETCDLTLECNRQVYTYVIPDVIAFDFADSEPQGFPNGRLLDDRAIDMTFVILWLDINNRLLEGNEDVSGHFLDAFFDLGAVSAETAGETDGPSGPVSLNPAQNDLEFPGEFPYLAPAH